MKKIFRLGMGVSAVLLLSLVVGCSKKPHKVLAAVDEGFTWTIDQMRYEAIDDGTLEHDTLLYDVGTIVFQKDKRRNEHGTGTIVRREYQSGNWTTAQTLPFAWSMEGDETFKITYQTGVEEVFQIDENQKNTQRWTSTSFESGDNIEREYVLSKVLN